MNFRHWILAGALAASGAAFAQGGGAAEGQQMPPPTGGGQQQPPPGGMEQGPGMQPGEMEARQQEAQKTLSQIYSPQGKKEAFEIRGKIAGFDQQTGAIVLQRPNMPNAMLLLTQRTDVKVDGKSASIQQLQPGSDVRASFNLAQGMPVAIAIDAKQPKGMKAPTGGAGKGGSQHQPQQPPTGGGMGGSP